MDKPSGEKINLDRAKGVFRYDAWVVPYDMIKKGRVSYVGADSRPRTVKMSKTSGFTRHG